MIEKTKYIWRNEYVLLTSKLIHHIILKLNQIIRYVKWTKNVKKNKSKLYKRNDLPIQTQ